MYTYSYKVQPQQMLKVIITSYCCQTSNCVECEKFREMKKITVEWSTYMISSLFGRYLHRQKQIEMQKLHVFLKYICKIDLLTSSF